MEFTNCDRCPISSGCKLQPGGERCVDKLVRMLRCEMEEKGVVERRLKHLLQSKYILQFDKVNPETHEYERDIKEADTGFNRQPVLYICDRRKCDVCNGECKLTADFRHAENFEISPMGILTEKERQNA